MDIITNKDDVINVIENWDWIDSDGTYSMYCNVFKDRVLLKEEDVEDYWNCIGEYSTYF